MHRRLPPARMSRVALPMSVTAIVTCMTEAELPFVREAKFILCKRKRVHVSYS